MHSSDMWFLRYMLTDKQTDMLITTSIPCTTSRVKINIKNFLYNDKTIPQPVRPQKYESCVHDTKKTEEKCSETDQQGRKQRQRSWWRKTSECWDRTFPDRCSNATPTAPHSIGTQSHNSTLRPPHLSNTHSQLTLSNDLLFTFTSLEQSSLMKTVLLSNSCKKAKGLI